MTLASGTSDSSERALREALGRLPMFPLPGVVLFPHALLPLHVFEERYKKMARDLLSSNRYLAMALLDAKGDKAGPGALSSADPRVNPSVHPVHPIMGVGEVVMAHELPDGRFNLVVRGRARVRLIEELTTEEPYRLISAALLPDLPVSTPAELADSDQALRALVGRLADAIPDGGELLRQVVASQETPEQLADVLAAALVTDPERRQKLLETRDVIRRVEVVTAEVAAMTERVAASPKVN